MSALARKLPLQPHAARVTSGPQASRAAVLRDLDGIVHVLTCGSVDDGKSTLIGRLLWESKGLPDDHREMVVRAARGAGTPGQLDYSLLLDGLVAEREQGITIDVAWRYVDTATRRLVIIDSPGHEQYTRNMASGASHADVAVMLVDARAGIKKQTRRHAAILHLMGVGRVVLAVNKMDLVGWSEARFRQIEQEFAAAVAPLSFAEAVAIPVSAREGDNVATPSQRMPWYSGRTLVSHLETVPSRVTNTEAPFRMPVQTVLRDGAEFRGLAGTISAGVLQVGDIVSDVLSGASAHVIRIATMDGDLLSAPAGKAVAIQLDTDLDISRGAVLSAAGVRSVKARHIETRLVWLADAALDMDRGLLLRTATDTVPVSALEVTSRLDLDTLGFTADTLCRTNDVVAAEIATSRPIAVDRFADHRATGAFLLVDPLTGATLAAGVILDARSTDRPSVRAGFKLTREILARGVCADLGTSPQDAREFARRTREVEMILAAAGVSLDNSATISP